MDKFPPKKLLQKPNLSKFYVRNLKIIPKTTSSNDINKNILYLLYFPNRNGLKDETGNSKKKLLDFRCFPGVCDKGHPVSSRN